MHGPTAARVRRYALAASVDAWRLAAFPKAGAVVSLLRHRLSGMRHLRHVALLFVSSVFLIIVAGLVWLDFANSRSAEARVEHTYQVLNASQLLFSNIQDAEARQREYLLTGEPQFLDRYRELAAAERAGIQNLRALTRDNEAQQARLTELAGAADARLAQLEEGITARRDENLEAATQIVRAGESAHLMRDIRGLLGAVETEARRLLSQRSQTAAEQAARTRTVLGAGTAFLVVMLLFAGAVIESDVSKLQASERVLRRQAELLDKAHEPILTWKLGGPIEYWNHGAEELYGLKREDIVGRASHDLLHTVFPSGCTPFETILARDGRWRGELTHLVGGREIIVESLMTIVTEPEGQQTILEVNRDITERKRAQEEIRQLNQELEQRVKDRTAELEASNRELEAFAYSVSHDLRAPLRGIDGWSHALLDDYGPQLPANGRHYLERVRAETQRMGQLIDGLLKLSRLTRAEMRRESVDLSSLARSILCRLREREPSRNMEFVIQEGLTANGDPHLLEIALSNLFMNAVKFTAPKPEARIEFARTRCGEELAFYIRDNGVGFNMAYAGMLFGAFQRLHKYSEFPGNGIGLATAQRVLRRHGGRIWADARPDLGATFFFTIGTGLAGERELAAKMV